MSGRRLRICVALLFSALWGTALGWQHWRGNGWLLDRLEATMTDFRLMLRGSLPSPSTVSIVAIDDEAVRQAGGFPLPRVVLAQLVQRIAELQPKAIALDLLLLDPGAPDDDAALAKTLRAAPSVIGAAAVYTTGVQTLQAGDGPLAQIPISDRLLLPLPRFAEAAEIGIVNVMTDKSGTPRAFPMLFRTADAIYAAMPLQAATVATLSDPVIAHDGIEIAGRFVPTDLGQTLPLNFYGPQGTITTVSAASVLAGSFPGDMLRDRVVVIGATVTGGGDVFPTPFDPVLPGVEVISTAIANLLQGDALERDRTVRLIDAATAVVLPVVLVGLLAWRRSALGFAVILTVALIWLGSNILAFQHNIWLSLALPMAAAGLPLLLFGFAEIWIDRRDAQFFANQTRLLQRFQAPALADYLATNPTFLEQPVRQEAGILFIDLTGFTGLSEVHGPTVVREVLNSFYPIVEAAAVECRGIITSFAGDGAMLVFGLPAQSEADAANGARCGVMLAQSTRAWIATLAPDIGSLISVKIGAHYGTVVLSRLGGNQQQITATGDTVNVASRLMEVAAREGADFAISDDLLGKAGPDSGPTRFGTLRGPLTRQIRGRAEPLQVWFWWMEQQDDRPESRGQQQG